MIAQHLGQPVIGNPARQVVDVVDADIGGKAEIAGAAMALSSVSVVTNSLRLKRKTF